MTETYVREMNRNYLILSGKEDEMELDYQMRMLTENEIPGLISAQIRQVDCHIEYYYEISGRVSLAQYLARHQMQYKELEALITGLHQVSGAAEEYLLDIDQVLLEPELIFLNQKGDTVSFCYGKDRNSSFLAHLRELMQYLLVRLDHSDEKTVRVGYALYQECQSDQCTIERCIWIFRNQERIWKKEENEQWYPIQNEESGYDDWESWQQETMLLTELPVYEAAQSHLQEESILQKSGRKMKKTEKKEWLLFGAISGILEMIVLIGILHPYVQERIDQKLLIAAALLLLLFVGFAVMQYRKESGAQNSSQKRIS